MKEFLHSCEFFQMSETIAYKWGEHRAKSGLYARGKPFGPDNKPALGGHNCLTRSSHITGVSEAPSLLFLVLISHHVSVLGRYLRALHLARWPTAQGSVISKGLHICPDPHVNYAGTADFANFPEDGSFLLETFWPCSISLITGDTQVKAVMWCHFRPIRRVTIKLKIKKTENKCWWGCGKNSKLYVLLVAM